MKALYALILVLMAGTAYGQLDPSKVKRQPSRDAVAIIIGIGNYKKIPKADFANADAQAFYDYAIRALGIKPENITLLIDESADDINNINFTLNFLYRFFAYQAIKLLNFDV